MRRGEGWTRRPSPGSAAACRTGSPAPAARSAALDHHTGSQICRTSPSVTGSRPPENIQHKTFARSSRRHAAGAADRLPPLSWITATTRRPGARPSCNHHAATLPELPPVSRRSPGSRPPEDQTQPAGAAGARRRIRSAANLPGTLSDTSARNRQKKYHFARHNGRIISAGKSPGRAFRAGRGNRVYIN